MGKLVSSAEQLEQQAKLAQSIEPLGKSLSYISKLPAPATPRITIDKSSIRQIIGSNSKPLSLPQTPSDHQAPLITIPDLDQNLPVDPNPLNP